MLAKIACVIFCFIKKENLISNFFKNTKACIAVASPPKLIINVHNKPEKNSFKPSLEMSRQPLVISKIPLKIALNILELQLKMEENRFEIGEKICKLFNISIITKNNAIKPPIISTEFTVFHINSPKLKLFLTIIFLFISKFFSL